MARRVKSEHRAVQFSILLSPRTSIVENRGKQVPPQGGRTMTLQLDALRETKHPVTNHVI